MSLRDQAWLSGAGPGWVAWSCETGASRCRGGRVPRTYDPEFRRRVVELVRAGRPVRVVAAELGLAQATVYRWKAQDLIDRGVKPGLSTIERGELAAASQRIKELETELALVKRAAALFEEGVRPKAKYPVIARAGRAGLLRQTVLPRAGRGRLRVLHVAAPGTLATPGPVCVADRSGASDPRRLPGHLRVAAGQRRVDLWPRRDRQPQNGAQDHAVARSVWAARIQEAVPQQGEQSNCR